jgi:hypothetical protein
MNELMVEGYRPVFDHEKFMADPWRVVVGHESIHALTQGGRTRGMNGFMPDPSQAGVGHEKFMGAPLAGGGVP